MIGVTLVLLASAIASAFFYSRWRHSYWASRGIAVPPGMPFVGHMHKIFSSAYGRWVYDNEVYRNHGDSKMCGLYEMLRPVLFVKDPELIKQILIKDFDHFTDRRTFRSANEDEKIGNSMLTNINGEVWKATRAIMTPTFTSGKMKGMFHLVRDKADALVSFCLDEASKKPFIDMKHNYGRYTLDTIASCAFGIECNSLVNDDAIFPKKAAVFFELKPDRMFKFFLMFGLPWLFKFLKMRLNPPELQFFKEVVEETVRAREKGQKRGDFLDLLLDARAQHQNGDESTKEIMDDDSLVAQSVLFIIVGYETTASTLAFTTHLLAKHPEIQRRLRQEMQDLVKEHGEITYQGIMEAKFLDACVLETLRMYPPIPTGERVTTKDYKIPDTNVTLTPGMVVQFPIWSLHHDEQYWSEPEIFNPDRFMPDNKANITPYTHLPFGMGPRNCIAMRFALMEAKVALAKMVLSSEFNLAPGRENLKLSTGPAILRAEEGVDLVLTPLREE